MDATLYNRLRAMVFTWAERTGDGIDGHFNDGYEKACDDCADDLRELLDKYEKLIIPAYIPKAATEQLGDVKPRPGPFLTKEERAFYDQPISTYYENRMRRDNSLMGRFRRWREERRTQRRFNR